MRNKVESIDDHRRVGIEPEVLQIAELLTSLIDKRLRVRAEERPTVDDELTVKEAAKLKGVDTRTVYSWISSKKVVVKRTPGGGIRILRSEIDKAA